MGCSTLFALENNTKSLSSSYSNQIDFKQAPKDEFFTKFCKFVKNNKVAYLEKENALILYAHPRLLDIVWDFFITLFLIVAGIVLGGATLFLLMTAGGKNSIGIFLASFVPVLIGFGLLCWAVFKVFSILSSLRKRFGFVPYLTFDAQGLKKFDKYVLKWKEIKDVFTGVTYRIESDGEFKWTRTVPVTKCGPFLLYADDNLLPISYGKASNVCRYCLAKYGKGKSADTTIQKMLLDTYDVSQDHAE